MAGITTSNLLKDKEFDAGRTYFSGDYQAVEVDANVKQGPIIRREDAVTAVQEFLNSTEEKGLNAGTADGMWGRKTSTAFGNFVRGMQEVLKAKGLYDGPIDGKVTDQFMQKVEGVESLQTAEFKKFTQAVESLRADGALDQIYDRRLSQKAGGHGFSRLLEDNGGAITYPYKPYAPAVMTPLQSNGMEIGAPPKLTHEQIDAMTLEERLIPAHVRAVDTRLAP